MSVSEYLLNFVINNHFMPALVGIVANKEGFTIGDKSEDWLNQPWAGVSFYREDWKYLKLRIEFQKEGLIFGFRKKDDDIPSDDIKGWNKLKKSYPYNTQKWIFNFFDEKHKDWNSKEAVEDLTNGVMAGLVGEMIDEAVKNAQGLDL